MISYFTWSEFDKSVEQIANKCKFKKFSGVYGVPRGGLCLAVALSHQLKIELISEPIKNSLIVDDIYETGITLTTFKNIEGAMFFVLFSKIKPTWWNTVHITKKVNGSFSLCLLYTSPSPRDGLLSRMPSSA